MNEKDIWMRRFEKHSCGIDTFLLQVGTLEQFLIPLGYYLEIKKDKKNSWHIRNSDKDSEISYLSLQSAVRLFNGVTCRFGEDFVDVLELKECLWFTSEQWQTAQATKEIVTLKLYKSAREGWKLRENWVEFI